MMERINIDAIYRFAEEFEEAIPETTRSGISSGSDRPAPHISFEEHADLFDELSKKLTHINNLSRIANQIVLSRDMNKLFKSKLSLVSLMKSISKQVVHLNSMLGV